MIYLLVILDWLLIEILDLLLVSKIITIPSLRGQNKYKGCLKVYIVTLIDNINYKPTESNYIDDYAYPHSLGKLIVLDFRLVSLYINY